MTQPRRMHADRRRAESFGAAAELYDSARPSYPPALVDAMILDGPSTALDVGCGTGKFARLLRERGVEVLGVEVDPQMAAVARTYGVQVEVSAFETWEPAGRTFDLVLSGQAWHWVDPVAGPRRAAEVLRPGGKLALAWNREQLDRSVRDAMDAAYQAVGLLPDRTTQPALQRDPDAGMDGFVEDLHRAQRFVDIERRQFAWQRIYTTHEWIELIRTHSEYLTLDEPRRAALEEAIRAAIDGLGGRFTAPYLTYSIFARRAA